MSTNPLLHFSGFKFNTIGRNSLLSRLSGPPIPDRTSSEDDEPIRDDEEPVDMDLDIDAPTSDDNAPSLLARLSDANVLSTSPQPHSHQPCAPSNPSASRKPPTGQITFKDLPNSCAQSPSTSRISPMHSSYNREVDRDTLNGPHPESSSEETLIDMDCFDMIAGVLPEGKQPSTGLPTPPPSCSSFQRQNILPVFTMDSPLSPGQLDNTSFSQCLFAPLTELLQEERAAWGEVLEAKRTHTENILCGVPNLFETSLPSNKTRTEIDIGQPVTQSSGATASTPAHPTASQIPACLAPEPSPTVNRSHGHCPNLSGSSSVSVSSDSHHVVKELDRNPTSTAAILNTSVSPNPPTSILARSVDIHPSSPQTTPLHDSSIEEKANANERHQTLKLDNETVCSRCDSPTRSSSAETASPRETHLKALLKSRKSSRDMDSKSASEQNQHRSLLVDNHTLSTPKSLSNPSQPKYQTPSGQDDSSDTPDAKSDIGRAHPTAMEGSAELRRCTEDETPPPAHSAPLAPGADSTLSFAPPTSEDSIAMKRKVSGLSVPAEREGKHASGTSKRQKQQKTSASNVRMDNTSGKGSAMLPDKVERPPSLPPKPTDETRHLLPPKPSVSGPSRADASPTLRKRGRSFNTKPGTDENCSLPSISSSRPMKRVKEEQFDSDIHIKLEEGVKVEEIDDTALSYLQQEKTFNPPMPASKVEKGVIQAKDIRQGMAEPVSSDTAPATTLSNQSEPESKTGSMPIASYASASLTQSMSRIRPADRDSPTANTVPYFDSSDYIHARPLNTHKVDDVTHQQSGLSGQLSPLSTFSGPSQTRSITAESSNPSILQTVTSNAHELSDRTSPSFSQDARQTDSTTGGKRLNTRTSNSRQSSVSGRRGPLLGSDRRAAGPSIEQRGRPQGRATPLIDHWSPPRPYSPPRQRPTLVADTYRPHSPSPPRMSCRISDDYRRTHSRERTPPRYSWQGRRRSLSRGCSFSPQRRMRSPSPRYSRMGYSRRSRSPRGRYEYGPSPRLSPRARSPSWSRNVSPNRYSTSGQISRGLRDDEARQPARNDSASTSETRSRFIDPRRDYQEYNLGNTDRQSYEEPRHNDQDVFYRRFNESEGQDLRYPQSLEVAPLRERQRTSYSPTEVRLEHAVFSEEHINDRARVDHQSTNLSSAQEARLHFHPQHQRVDSSNEVAYTSGNDLARAKLPEQASAAANSSQSRHSIVEANGSASSLVSLGGPSIAQAVPSPLPPEPEPRITIRRPAMPEVNTGDVHAQPEASATFQRYRYVEPVEVTNADRAADAHGNRVQNTGKVDSKQTFENKSVDDWRQAPPHRIIQLSQNTHDGQSASINSNIGDVSKPSKTPSPRQRKESTRSSQVIETPVVVTKLPPGHAVKATRERDENENTARNLMDRIGDAPIVNVSMKTSPGRSRWDEKSQSAIAHDSPPNSGSLASRLGVATSSTSPTKLADRITIGSTKPTPAPSLISRFRDAPETPKSGSSLPPKPAITGQARSARRPSPPPSNTSSTLLDRMQSPVHELLNRPHDAHTGRASTAKGRGRGGGGAQNAPRNASNTHSSYKPSLQDRFS